MNMALSCTGCGYLWGQWVWGGEVGGIVNVGGGGVLHFVSHCFFHFSFFSYFSLPFSFHLSFLIILRYNQIFHYAIQDNPSLRPVWKVKKL